MNFVETLISYVRNKVSMAGEHEFLKNTFDEIPEKCETMNDYLFMSNVLNSVQQKLYFKLKQIHRHESMAARSIVPIVTCNTIIFFLLSGSN